MWIIWSYSFFLGFPGFGNGRALQSFLCMEVTGQEGTQLSLWGDALHYSYANAHDLEVLAYFVFKFWAVESINKMAMQHWLALTGRGFLTAGEKCHWQPKTAFAHALDRLITHQTVQDERLGGWSLCKRSPDRQFHGLIRSPNSEVNIYARLQLMRRDSSMLVAQISRQRWPQDE